MVQKNCVTFQVFEKRVWKRHAMDQLNNELINGVFKNGRKVQCSALLKMEIFSCECPPKVNRSKVVSAR